VVIDTGDAKEGFISTVKTPVEAPSIGSNKKVIMPGDVIISRLRPYLRQVAFVDQGIAFEENTIIVCSNEFYVIRSINGSSIAYLVPLLLSDEVQEILEASQEGGHHPRFNQNVLENLIIPSELLASKNEVSRRVEKAASLVREGRNIITDLSIAFRH